MREIKFRAWDKRSERMAEVGSLEFFRGDVPIRVNEQSGRWHADDYILMQFTGLKDMNGKEIYEGDILLETEPRGNKYKVVSVPGGFAINMFQDELSNIIHFESLADMQNNSYVQGRCKVIGNIYENSSLLK